MANVWINEFHYDNGGPNNGADVNEFIEIAGLAGTDLTGWKIQLYNGSNNGLYTSGAEIALSGTITDSTGTGFGFISIDVPGIQNGSPDGFALIAPNGTVSEFLSYEGTITAINGAAAGMTSTDVGVAESGTASSGTGSIQRQGTGTDSTHFRTWALLDQENQATRDGLNQGQTIGTTLPTLSIAATDAVKDEGDTGETVFTFTVTRSSTTGSPTAKWSLTGIGGAGQASLDDFIDYVPGTVEFEDNSLTATITIRVAADAEYELDETFSVTLSEPVGATIANGTADGQIDNDDVATEETLSISATNAVQAEGTGETPTISTFTITRENGTGQTHVNWVINGLNENGLTAEDFDEINGTVTFEEGATEAVIQVYVVGDKDIEGDEPFSVEISTEKEGTSILNDTANGTITNDDAPQSFSIAATDAVKDEGDTGETVFTFTVTRTHSTGEAATVNYTLTGLGGAGQATTADFLDGEEEGTVEFAENETTKTIQIKVRGDTTVEQNESFSVTLSDPSAGEIGTAAASGRIVNDDYTRIYQIQGNGHTSSYVGQGNVTTRGVITGIQMTGTTRGFYIQDVNGDGDATTSDAMFVFRGSNWTPNVEIGDMVSVTGSVVEYKREVDNKPSSDLTLTQFGTAATVSVLSKGHELPEAVVIGPNGLKPPTGDVASAKAFYEALEGMRVTVEPTRVVGATNNFGEIYTVIEGAYDPESLNSRGGLSITEGDFNPERIQFDNIRDSLSTPMVDVGARLAAQTGIMSYGFGAYEVLIDTTPVVTAQSTLQAEETDVKAWNEFFLSFGNYNVENLDINDNDGDADVDGGQFAKLAQQIVKNMGSPHVLALQELQDDSGTVNNGTVSADKTLKKLVDEIVKAGGPRYKFAYLNPEDGKDGGATGGNIRQAFLYNEGAGVELVEDSLERITDPDPNAATNAFTASRKPLVAKFKFNGEEYTFINNHLNSKNGDDPVFGENDPPNLKTEAQRTKQAQFLNAYVDDLLEADANANIVLLGDLNDFSWSKPLKTLDGSFDGGQQVLWNTADDFIANPLDRTDYVYEGNSQSLDHIYVSAAMRARMEALDIVRINSEFDIEQRASDHDALVARSTFRVTRATINNPDIIGDAGSNALIGNGNANVLSGGVGRDYLEGNAGDDILLGGEGADGLYGGDGIDYVSYVGATSGVTASLDGPLANTGEAAGDTYNSIENMRGSAFTDVLVGNMASNLIDGDAGADVLQGNGGNDTYIVDNAFDRIIEAMGGGTDTVRTSISFTLTANMEVEVLTATGSDSIDLTGNAFANTVNGTTAANVIDGGAGADRMVGLGGDDTYIVDNAGDVVIEGAGDGSDTIQTSVDFTLGSAAEIECLIVTGSANVSLTGNAIVNTITGNAGANKVYGGLGNDILRGGSGKDTFVFDTRTDKSTNVDRLHDFSVKDDSIHLDNKIFTKLGSGSLSKPKKFASDMFVKGTAAKDQEDRIVYDNKTGALYYDQDGTGSKAQVKIATLNKGLGLTYNDFFVI